MSGIVFEQMLPRRKYDPVIHFEIIFLNAKPIGLNLEKSISSNKYKILNANALDCTLIDSTPSKKPKKKKKNTFYFFHTLINKS